MNPMFPVNFPLSIDSETVKTSLKQGISKKVPVLILAGMELTFLIAVLMVLCFVFVSKTVFITH